MVGKIIAFIAPKKKLKNIKAQTIGGNSNKARETPIGAKLKQS